MIRYDKFIILYWYGRLVIATLVFHPTTFLLNFYHVIATAASQARRRSSSSSLDSITSDLCTTSIRSNRTRNNSSKNNSKTMIGSLQTKMMMEAARQQRQTKERMGKGMDDENEAGSIILGYTYAVRIPSLPSSSTIVQQSVVDVDEERDGENDESCIIVEGGVPFSSKTIVKPNLRIDMNDANESRPTTSRRKSSCKEEEDEEEEEVDDEEEDDDDDDEEEDDDEPFATVRSKDDNDDEEKGEEEKDDDEPFATVRSKDDNDDEEEGEEEEDDDEPFATVRSNDGNDNYDNNAYIIPTLQILRVNEEEDIITTTATIDILREGIRTVNAYAADDKEDNEDNDNDDDDDDLSTHVMFDEVDGRGCSSSSPEDSRPILLKSATSLTSLRSSLLSTGKNNAFQQLQSLSKRLSSSSSSNTRRNSTTSNNVTNKEYWLRKNCHHLLDHIDNQEDNTVISVIHPVVGERGEGTEDKDENTMEMVFYETY